MDVLDALASFGSTGRVGLVGRGASLGDLAAVYGAPLDLGRVHKRRRWPHRYGYGDVEMVACRCRIVTHIAVPTWRATVMLPTTHTAEAEPLPARVTYAQVVQALAAIDCRWEPVGSIQGQPGLRTQPTQVEFTFVTGNGPEPVLHGAATWSAAHDCLAPAEAAAEFPNDFPQEQHDG